MVEPPTPQDKTENAHSGEFWRKFSEKGFNERKSHDSEDLDKLMNNFRYSDLISDDQDNQNNDAPSTSSANNNLLETPEKGVRRSKSSVSDYAKSLSTKPPVESKTEEQGKLSTSKSKKAKQRFKTLGKKGIKIMRGMRRNSSFRGSELDLDLASLQHLDQTEAYTTGDSPATPDSPAVITGIVF